MQKTRVSLANCTFFKKMSIFGKGGRCSSAKLTQDCGHKHRGAYAKQKKTTKL